MKSFALNASKKTKSTSAGQIPVDWASIPLGEIATIYNGRGFKPHEWGDKGLPIIRIQNLNGSSAFNYFSGEYDPKILVRPGDLLFCWSGSKGSSFGPRFWDRPIDGVLNYHTWRIECGSRVHASFLFHMLRELTYRIEATAQGAAGLVHIQKGWIEAREIALPPLAEQHKIADILSTWEEASLKLAALIEAKERRKQALVQQLLSGRLRFPKFGKTAWRKVRMNTVLTRVFRPMEWAADKPLSLVSVRRRCGGLFRRADVLGSDYKTQDLHDLKTNDFLVSKRQVVHGAWAVVTPEFEGTHVSKEYAILVNSAPDKLHMPFFGWLAQTSRMIRLARVASTGVHIEKLIFDPEVFLRDLIQIPPTLAEQEQIAETLDACAAEVRLLRQQRTALDRQKRGLMQRLLTGKIRV